MKIEKNSPPSSLRIYVDLLTDLHSLILAGSSSSDKAEKIRDKMDKPWHDLSEDEKRIASAISINFERLRVTKSAAKKTADLEEEDRKKVKEILEHFGSNDPARELIAISNLDLKVLPDVMCYRCYRCAQAFGFIKAEIAFLRHAFVLSGDGYRGFALLNLVHSTSGPMAAVSLYRHLQKRVRFHKDEFTLGYLGIMLNILNEHPLSECLLKTGESIFRRYLFDPSRRGSPFGAHAAVLLAEIYERNNQTVEAVKVLGRAAQKFRANQEVLLKLGLLLYGTDTKRSVAIFSRMISHNTNYVWPYLFLAHFYVTHDHPLESKELASKALALNPSFNVQADLLEIMAIANQEIGGDREETEKLFLRAVERDDSNQRIASNFARFKEFQKLEVFNASTVKQEAATDIIARSTETARKIAA